MAQTFHLQGGVKMPDGSIKYTGLSLWVDFEDDTSALNWVQELPLKTFTANDRARLQNSDGHTLWEMSLEQIPESFLIELTRSGRNPPIEE